MALAHQCSTAFAFYRSGAVLSYKKRLAGCPDLDSAATAFIVGAGIVNWFGHAHFEATFLSSGAVHGNTLTYGGLRVMQVAPISDGAVHKTPTAGGFFGFRFGNAIDAVFPELAVYYDHSSLGVRKGDVIFVPSISLRVDVLGLISGRSRPRNRK